MPADGVLKIQKDNNNKINIISLQTGTDRPEQTV